MSYVPLERLVYAATYGMVDQKGRAAQIYFDEDPNASGGYKSSQIPVSFEQAVRNVLAPYGINPSVSHVDKHGKEEHKELKISPEQYNAACERYIAEATSKLKELTGCEWTYEPEMNGYISSALTKDTAAAASEKLYAAGMEMPEIHSNDFLDNPALCIAGLRGEAVTSDTAFVDVPKGYLDVWLANQKKPAKEGHAATALARKDEVTIWVKV